MVGVPELVTSIVLMVTGHPNVNVSCATAGLPNSSGTYWIATDTIFLSPWVCGAISKGPKKGRLFGYAVAVVAHESSHATGLIDETDAECYAQKQIPRVLKSLKLTKADYRRILEQALSFDNQLPPDYHVTSCG